MSAIDQVVTAFEALRRADATGTTTDAHIVAALLALAPIRSRFPDELGHQADEALESRLSDAGRLAYRREINDLVERAIADALAAGLPVLEPAGLPALAAIRCTLAEASR